MTHHYPRPPFQKGGRITDDYSSSHRARDIAPRHSDNGDVFALESGTVVDMWTGMGSGEDYANTILIRSYGGMLTAYAHVDGSGKVMIGNTVKFGKKIGKVDLSGGAVGRPPRNRARQVRACPDGLATEHVVLSGQALTYSAFAVQLGLTPARAEGRS